MARIYSFLPKPATVVRRTRGIVGPATIIIFPGIRYEPGKADGSGSAGGGGSTGRKSVPGRR